MSNKKVLFVIDDDEDDRELFQEALGHIEGSYTCFTAPNGEDALQQLRRGLPAFPHFIFLDLNMPLLDGKQCLKEIRSMEEFDHTPVIIYSTSSSARDIKETAELGATKFFTKPSSFDELCIQLRHVLLSM